MAERGPYREKTDTWTPGGKMHGSRMKEPGAPGANACREPWASGWQWWS